MTAASSLKAASTIEQIYTLSATELAEVENAIATRRIQLRTNMRIGDKVRFNEHTATRYMIGVTGVLVGKKTKKWIVRPDNDQVQLRNSRFERVNWNDPDAPVTYVDITAPAEILDAI